MTTGGEIIFEEWKLFSNGRETVRKLERDAARGIGEILIFHFFIFKSSDDVNLCRVERAKLR